MKDRKKLLAIVLGGLLALIVCLWLVFGRDEPPPDVSDFVLARREVPEAANGFALITGIEGLARKAEDEGEDGTAGENGFLSREEREAWDHWNGKWDREVARRSVERCAAVLERLEAALARADFQVPPAAYPPEEMHLMTFRDLAQILVHRAVLRLEEGKDREAFGDALKAARLGKAIQRSQGLLVVLLVGLGIEQHGLKAISDLLDRSPRPVSSAWPSHEALEALRPDRYAFSDTLKVEFGVMTGFMDRLGTGEVPSEYRSRLPVWVTSLGGVLYKPNGTKRLMAEMLRTSLTEDPWKVPFRELDGREHLPALAGLLNFSGKRMAGFLIPTLTRSSVQVFMTDAILSAVEVKVALKRFHAARGALPAALEDLVPTYIPRIPADPFDGKPLRYSREKRSIWSVGTDLKDAGGSRLDAPDTKRDPRDPAGDRLEPTLRVRFGG